MMSDSSTTVVCHLGNNSVWKQQPESRLVLETAVQRSSIVAHRGSIVFNAWLYKNTENITDKCFRRIIKNCFQVVKQRNRVKDTSIIEVYDEIYGNSHIDGTGLTEILDLLGDKYAKTCFKNFCDDVFHKHILKFLMTVYELPSKYLAKTMLSAVFSNARSSSAKMEKLKRHMKKKLNRSLEDVLKEVKALNLRGKGILFVEHDEHLFTNFLFVNEKLRVSGTGQS